MNPQFAAPGCTVWSYLRIQKDIENP